MIMRPPADYRALHDIQIPDSYGFAARAGDDITEMQRVNLGLVVGDDPATADIAPLNSTAMNRPDDDADRLEWQNYAVVRDVPYSEAVTLDRADLIKRVGKDDGLPVGLTAVQPQEGDRKSLWVSYATGEMGRVDGLPEPQARERAEAATKADLIVAFGAGADPQARADFIAAPTASAPTASAQTDTAQTDAAEQG